jgi:hypothetical protein
MNLKRGKYDVFSGRLRIHLICGMYASGQEGLKCIMHHAAQHAATMQGRYAVACVLKLVIVVVVRIENFYTCQLPIAF